MYLDSRDAQFNSVFACPFLPGRGAAVSHTRVWAKLDAQRCMQLGVLAERVGLSLAVGRRPFDAGRGRGDSGGLDDVGGVGGHDPTRAKLGIIHYNHVFRHPAFTAKMVATLDQISGGRMIHFVDFGNNSREYLAYGMYDDDEDLDEAARTHRIAQMIEGLDLDPGIVAI